jgi:hypothetical protein
VHGTLSYYCMRPYTSNASGLELPVFEALSYWCMRLVYASLSYYCIGGNLQQKKKTASDAAAAGPVNLLLRHLL